MDYPFKPRCGFFWKRLYHRLHLVGQLSGYAGAFSRFRSDEAKTDDLREQTRSSGANLVYSTYLGGNSFDASGGIVVDALGRAFVGGSTQSTDFPATPLAFQRSVREEQDAFVTQLNPGGTGLVYSTLLGGTNNDGASGIALDLAGSAYVTGVTTSTDFPRHSWSPSNCLWWRRFRREVQCWWLCSSLLHITCRMGLWLGSG